MSGFGTRALGLFALVGVGCSTLAGLEDGTLAPSGGTGGASGGGGSGTGGAGGATGGSGGATGGTGGATGGTGGSGGASGAGSGGAAGAGATGGGGSAAKWPDSITVFCSDGSLALAGCPNPGDPAYGQDGNFLLAVPSYQGAAIIATDSVTGLSWQLELSSWITAAAAAQTCDALTLAGLGDWRLPTRLELYSLVDFGRQNPAVNASTFANLGPEAIWTSTKAVNDSVPSNWIVAFGDGRGGGNDVNVGHRSFCTRGATFSGAFQAQSETVIDHRTGLWWQTAYPQAPKTWLAALGYCLQLNAVGLEGKTDWRLPSVKELLTIVDETQVLPNPSLDSTLFPNTVTGAFWTSTPNPGDPSQAYFVHFGGGFVDFAATTQQHALRCVRGP